MGQRANRQVLPVAVTRAAPFPVFRRPYEFRFRRIVLDVTHDAPEMLFVANAMIKIVLFPKGAHAIEQFVGGFGGIALPTMKNSSKRRLP